MSRVAYDPSGTVRYLPDVLSASADLATLERRGQFDANRTPPYLQSRTANWNDIATSDRLYDTARKSVVVYACLTYLADAVAESPIRVYRRVDGDPKEVPDHRARQVLANPNPYMSESEFLALCIMAMGMQGYAVIEKVRSAGGLPVELWPLRPDWLSKALQPNGQAVRDWTYRQPGKDPRTIPNDDLIVIPYRHDERQERPGVSPLQIAAREVGIDSSLTDFLKTFLDAGGIPPFVLEYAEAINDPSVIAAMQEMWRQKYSGSQAFSQLPILHGGYKIVKIGDGINDMAWPDLRAITEDKICQAFRVPRELVQTHSTAAGGSGLTTTEQEGAMASLQRYGATPLRNRIDGALTRSFLFDFTGGDPQYELAFDVSDVLALQEDQDKRHTRVRADYQAGIVTLDEARQDLGLQPLPNQAGDVFAIPFNVVLTPATELNVPTTPAMPIVPPAKGDLFSDGMMKVLRDVRRQDGEELNRMLSAAASRRIYRDVKALNSIELEFRANATAGNRRQQGKLATILDRKLRGLFSAQAERIAGNIAKSSSVTVKSLVDVNWQHEENELADILNRFYLEAGKAAADSASSLLGVDISFDLANPHINQVVTRLGTRIRSIAETTRQDVSRTVADGLTQGQTLDEIAGSVRDLLGGDSYRGRATTIARTESQVAYNSASIASYQASGVVSEIEMADNPDHDSDPMPPTDTTCADRNGLTAPLGDAQDFIDSAHPNCQLAVLPVVALGA